MILEDTSITSNSGDQDDYFGYNVSVSGNYALIGAPFADISGTLDQGKAYVFQKSGSIWSWVQSFISADGSENDQFGLSVSISGDYAIVGAMFHDINGKVNQGKAYIYHNTGSQWIFQDTLIASDGEEYDNFGCSVSISGDYAIVGARHHDVGANLSQGKVYIFQRSGTDWIEVDTLTAYDGQSYDEFGYSVFIEDESIIVGAPFHITPPGPPPQEFPEQGKVYFFRLHHSGNFWTDWDEVTASDGGMDNRFGYSVSLSGNHAIVGTFNYNGDTTSPGKAYVYYLSADFWEEQEILVASDSSQSDYFGHSVSISNGFALIGAYGSDVASNDDQGKAYIFFRSGTEWYEQEILSASDGSQNDIFGHSVSISGNHAFISAPGKTVAPNSNQGKVYISSRN